MLVQTTLGGILLDGFEAPEKLNFGGEQRTAIHKLIGGVRVVDAMGRDDDDIEGTGRFRGPDALTRAQSVDYLRVQGQPIELTYHTMRYQVLLTHFKADLEQPFEIPFTYRLLVIVDENAPIAPAPVSVDPAITEDLNQVNSLAASLGIAGISTGVASITSAAGNIETFQNAAETNLSIIQNAIASTQSSVVSAQTVNSIAVAASGTVAGVSGGGNPATMATGLLAQATAFQNLGNLYNLNASLTRMATNISNAAT